MSYLDWTGTVLLVEDDDSVADVFARVLVKAGMAVLRTRTLEGALVMLETKDIDCAVLDLKLPDVTLEAAERGYSIDVVRAHSPKPLPIVVTTGYGEIPSSIGPNAAQEWLLKPVHPLSRIVWAVRAAVSYCAGASDVLDLTRSRLEAKAVSVYGDSTATSLP